MEKKTVYLLAAVALLLFIYILYLSVTIPRPIIFGDEGFHAATSKWMREEAAYPKWYPLFYNTENSKGGFMRPPLLYFIFSGAALLGWNEFIVKLLIPLFSILAAGIIYLWMRDFLSHIAALFAALMFLVIPSQVTYSVLLYSDGLFLLMTVLTLFFFYKFIKTEKLLFLTLTSIFAAFAILTKASGPVLLLFMFTYGFFVDNKKMYLKKLAFAFILILLMLTPWFIRNLMLYGSPFCDNFPFISKLFPTTGCNISPPGSAELSIAERTAQVGTEVDLLRLGILNFFAFAYGNPLTILLIAGGLALIFINRDKFNSLLLAFFIASLALFYFAGGRAEDAARYVLPIVIPISMISALYIDKITQFKSRYMKYLGFIIVIIFAFLVVQPGLAKISTMGAVKQFSPAFIEANQWIATNTPKDAVIFSLWTAATVYHSERSAVWSVAKLADILIANSDEKVLPVLREYGIDYILVAKFSISQQAYQQAYPLQFVNYLESSSHYKNVYENSDTIIYQVV